MRRTARSWHAGWRSGSPWHCAGGRARPFSRSRVVACSSGDPPARPSAAAPAPRGSRPRPRTGDRIRGRCGPARADAGARAGDARRDHGRHGRGRQGRDGHGRDALLPARDPGDAGLLEGLSPDGALPREGRLRAAGRRRSSDAGRRHGGRDLGRHGLVRQLGAGPAARAPSILNPMPPA